jgi:hypothetical protein
METIGACRGLRMSYSGSCSAMQFPQPTMCFATIFLRYVWLSVDGHMIVE